jgi:hypothetical protein
MCIMLESNYTRFAVLRYWYSVRQQTVSVVVSYDGIYIMMDVMTIDERRGDRLSIQSKLNIMIEIRQRENDPERQPRMAIFRVVVHPNGCIVRN